MKKSSIFLLLSLFSLKVYAQDKNLEPIIVNDKKGMVQSAEFPELSKNISSQDFFNDYLKITNDDEFKKMPHKSDNKDYTHDHFDQYYKGIKVDGAGYNFHFKNGKLYFAHGHYVKCNSIGVVSKITSKKAQEIFANQQEIPLNTIESFFSELIIKESGQMKVADTLSTARLVFKVYFSANHPNNTDVGYIDALTGEVLLKEPILSNCLPPATGTFATRYNGSRTATTHNYGGAFHLADSTRGAIIHTWDLNNSLSITSRVELSDNDNNWTTAEHGANKTDMALDVHWALQKIYDRLNFSHSINSFNNPITGTGFPINAHVRYGVIENAYWDGIDNVLLFGEGGSTFKSLASIDVVAHEYGHGITDFQIGWSNSGNQKAFNEGLSDIWGAIMEHRINPGNVWQMGEQLMINKVCLRDMQNTNNTNAYSQIANTFGSTQYNNTSDDYVRSGVFSHWAYLLANGGSGTNGIGNYYTVYGVGMDQLENLIVAAVFNNFLDNTTTYSEIRTAMVNAARSLCSNQNGFLVQQVENAWYAVGVGSANQLSINSSSLICSSSTFTVNNLQSGTSVTWSSSNSGGLTINSSGVATRVNNFSGDIIITATITSACGSISLTKSVRVGNPATPNLTIIGVAPYGAVDAQTPLLSGANYNWYRDGTFLQSGTSNYVTLNGGTCGVQHYMQVSLTNSCGTSPLSPYGGAIPNTTYTWACGFRAYPNPTKDYLIVEFENTEDANALPERINFYQETSTNLVKSIAVQDLIKQNAFKDGNKIELDVKEFPRGTYYLHIIPNSTSNQKVEKIRIILE